MKSISLKLGIIVLIFAWVFSGWPLSLAEETTPPTPTEEITVQEQTDEEAAPEEAVSEEPMPPPEPIPPPKPPFKYRQIAESFRISRTASHRCEADGFRLNISGRPSASGRLFIKEGVSAGELVIGSLPLGIDIVFSANADYRHSADRSASFADFKIENQNGSQKSSFNIPILYTDKTSGKTTICQINIINL
jgi:hypothetical protein